MAIGITSWGAYVPLHRMGTGTRGWTSQRERAVANFDEDSITMGVAAACNCLRDFSRENIGGLYFASTTLPYREKSNATIVAVASDLPSTIFATDFTGSLAAGTNALKSAIDAARGGSNRQTLLVASDLRVPQIRSESETVFGDGAAALLIGDSNIVAEFEGCYAVSQEILDIWRAENDPFIRTWEERFVLEQGYLKILPQAILKVMEEHNLAAKDFARAVLYAPDAKRHQEMAKKLGFNAKSQTDDSLFKTMGNTGVSFAIIMLAAALEEAKSGDRILLANYGSGANAFIFRVTDEIENVKKNRRKIAAYLDAKKTLPDYETYLTWRGLINKASSVRRPPSKTPSPSAMLREVDKNLGFRGVKCKQCGYPQYPPQRICTKCQSKDNFEDYRFSDKRGSVFTYTLDYLTPSLDPPTALPVINFEGGGRIFSMMTDRDVNEIKIGMPVEMTFRKFYTSEGIHNYVWKCMPIRV